jgi:hypothetical protein
VATQTQAVFVARIVDVVCGKQNDNNNNNNGGGGALLTHLFTAEDAAAATAALTFLPNPHTPTTPTPPLAVALLDVDDGGEAVSAALLLRRLCTHVPVSSFCVFFTSASGFRSIEKTAALLLRRLCTHVRVRFVSFCVFFASAMF